MSVFGLYPLGQWAQDFTPKIEVKMRAYEVKISAYD